MDGMRSMEQRRGREFNGEVITVDFCENVGTDWISGTEFDLGSDYVLGIANRLVITHAGADFIIGTGSFIHFAYGFFDPRVVVFVGGHCGGK